MIEAYCKQGTSKWLWLSIFGLLTLTVISDVQADIYVYVDSRGVMNFTNTPTSSEYKLYMKEKKRASKNKWLVVKKYDDVIIEAASVNGIAFPLLKALIHVESCFNPKAVSRKGALGLCQIMPQNLKKLSIEDPFDPKQNIMGGAQYLKNMIDRFDGQLSLALAAYNAGPTVVELYQDIPPYPETQNYVEKVLRLFKHYKKS